MKPDGIVSSPTSYLVCLLIRNRIDFLSMIAEYNYSISEIVENRKSRHFLACVLASVLTAKHFNLHNETKSCPIIRLALNKAREQNLTSKTHGIVCGNASHFIGFIEINEKVVWFIRSFLY